jgi:hypothetical protein
MSVRNAIALLLALSALAFLAACGGSSNSITNPTPPPTGGFSNSNLNGTYVFSVSGTDSTGAPYAILGTFTANGAGGNNKGGITGGTFDINDDNTSEFSSGPIAAATINSNSSYSISVDGRGQAVLNTSISNLNITLDFVLSSSSHGLVTEFDGFGSGSGTIDLQTAGTSLNGSYAFSFSGADASGNAFATVGNFAVGAGGAITGLEDFNDNILTYADQTLTGTVVLGPSATPATTLSTPLSASAFGGPQTYDVYAIDATHLKFIEMDAFATFSGDAYSQSSATISAATMPFTLLGFVGSAPAAAGGFMVTDGQGGITGTEDVNNDGSASSAPLSFSANYSAGGTGRYTLSNFSGFFGGSTYAAYPSSGGLLLLEIDNTNIMSGAAYTQSSTSFAASQGYGLNFTGINLGGGTGSAEEVDDIAEFTADSTGTTVTGVVDENYAPSGSPIFGQALSGTYTAPDSNGRGSIVATAGNNSHSTLNGGFALTFYTVDGTTFPFVETDSGQVAAGVFVEQNASASAAAAHPSVFVVRPLIRPHALKPKQK